MAKNDLLTYVHRRMENKSLLPQEIENSLGDFIITGSETVATTLTAISFHLVRHQDVFQQLNEELFEAVERGSDITGSVIS